MIPLKYERHLEFNFSVRPIFVDVSETPNGLGLGKVPVYDEEMYLDVAITTDKAPSKEEMLKFMEDYFEDFAFKYLERFMGRGEGK